MDYFGNFPTEAQLFGKDQDVNSGLFIRKMLQPLHLELFHGWYTLVSSVRRPGQNAGPTDLHLNHSRQQRRPAGGNYTVGLCAGRSRKIQM